MSADAGTLAITELDGAVRFTVRVQPRASRVGVAGVHGGALKVRVHAPPVEGAANAAVIEVIADWLDVSHRTVRLVRGERARTKIIEVAGVDVSEVRRRLGV